MNHDNREMFLGAKVTLDHKSRYWKFDSKSNPRGIVGQVTRSSSSGAAFFVKWSNGESNGYPQGDLKVLGEIADECS